MIVWGGQGYTGDLNSGGRYDPVANTWRPTSVINAPTPRMSHTALWTGQEMIVWGGSRLFPNRRQPQNTGRMYLPDMDVWASVNVPLSILPRSMHVAVWTGDFMLIWGGSVDPFYENPLTTGGRYAPHALGVALRQASPVDTDRQVRSNSRQPLLSR